MEFDRRIGIGKNKHGVNLIAPDRNYASLFIDVYDEDQDIRIFLASFDMPMSWLMLCLGIKTIEEFDKFTVDWLWQEYMQGFAYLHCEVGYLEETHLRFMIRDGKTIVMDTDFLEVAVLDEIIDSGERAEEYTLNYK